MPSTFLNFSCLDELIQVIYQSVHRFVLLSNITGDEWVLHLGLSGPEGRWWRGSWKEEDIFAILGSKPSDKLLGTFARKLAESIIQGDVSIGDWSTEPDAKIKLIFAPSSSSKKPMSVSLAEMPAKNAAAYATDVFLAIARQAQSRKNQLYGSSYQAPAVLALPVSSYEPDDVPAPSSAKLRAPQDSESLRTRHSKIELEETKKRKKSDSPETSEANSKPKAKAIPKPLKGASLANPNKKARKYQAIEFESDEE